ncbi:MAG: tyrosine-type recombinase/integrase [Candidatus Thorarchaeota archaeon]|nr:tyrosine-type recombinase/integrase [Candidatus Thorarchaeota archaeon]
MSNNNLIGFWIRHFLTEHLVGERNLSQNTLESYRDTFVLLLPFVAQKTEKPIEKLSVSDIQSSVIYSFLQHIEEQRKCCAATRNQRLAAMRALSHFIGERSPEHIAWSAEIWSIPFKKTYTPAVGYLEKREMDALLDAPDRNIPQGRRDYTLLLFMYNTGARASEVAQVAIRDLNFQGIPSVRILGKGNKERYCPLWALTVENLHHLVDGRALSEPVFLNRYGQSITRFGIYFLVERCVSKAVHKVPSLRIKRIHPHTIRHTSAVHLLRSGVDINTIRAWLGHVSLDTTNIYAEVDLEMKAKALNHCEIFAKSEDTHWNNNPDLLAFLKSL